MIIQKILDEEDQNNRILPKIRCKICGREFEFITITHLKTHGITMCEYREQFPDASLASDGYRKKLSEVLTGKIPTPKMIEGRKKQSKAISGEKHYMFGRHLPEKHKQHISEANLGNKLSEEHKQHLRDSSPHLSGEDHPMKGRHQTKEAKQKVREARLGTHPSEKTRQKMSDARRGEKNGSWKDGISFLPYCEKFDDDLKERVRNFFNRCCYVCGKNETDNGRKLDVHHVNYDKMVCCNDVKPLFVPLCQSCHSKTLKDREYWEEFFTVSLNYLTDGECFLPKSHSKSISLKYQ